MEEKNHNWKNNFPESKKDMKLQIERILELQNDHDGKGPRHLQI